MGFRMNVILKRKEKEQKKRKLEYYYIIRFEFNVFKKLHRHKSIQTAKQDIFLFL